MGPPLCTECHPVVSSCGRGALALSPFWASAAVLRTHPESMSFQLNPIRREEVVRQPIPLGVQASLEPDFSEVQDIP